MPDPVTSLCSRAICQPEHCSPAARRFHRQSTYAPELTDPCSRRLSPCKLGRNGSDLGHMQVACMPSLSHIGMARSSLILRTTRAFSSCRPRAFAAAFPQVLRAGEESVGLETKEVPIDQQRLLQVGILGVPNAGKSTLTNALVGSKVWRVCMATEHALGPLLLPLSSRDWTPCPTLMASSHRYQPCLQRPTPRITVGWEHIHRAPVRLCSMTPLASWARSELVGVRAMN